MKKSRDIALAMANEGLILLRKNIDVEVEIRSEQKLDVSDGQVTTTIIKE